MFGWIRLFKLNHPDFGHNLRFIQAQKAFALLTKAKEDLLDEQKRAVLNKIVIEAEEKVKAKRDEEMKQYIKKFKKEVISLSIARTTLSLLM